MNQWFQEAARKQQVDNTPLHTILEAHNEEGHLVGAAEVVIRHGVADLRAIALHPEHRRQGLGSHLLREAEIWAKKHGANLMILSTWDHQAKPFYEKHRYVVKGSTSPLANGRQKFWMEKPLA